MCEFLDKILNSIPALVAGFALLVKTVASASEQIASAFEKLASAFEKFVQARKTQREERYQTETNRLVEKVFFSVESAAELSKEERLAYKIFAREVFRSLEDPSEFWRELNPKTPVTSAQLNSTHPRSSQRTGDRPKSDSGESTAGGEGEIGSDSEGINSSPVIPWRKIQDTCIPTPRAEEVGETPRLPTWRGLHLAA